MIIGACTVELYMPGSGSLKQKRSALKPLLLRLRKEFNLCTAEIDHQDLWQSAAIALVTVGSDLARVQQVLERSVRWIRLNRPDLEVVDWHIELI